MKTEPPGNRRNTTNDKPDVIRDSTKDIHLTRKANHLLKENFFETFVASRAIESAKRYCARAFSLSPLHSGTRSSHEWEF